MNPDTPSPDPASPPPGGSGGETTAPGIRTTRLVERAIRENWPIPDQLRPALMDRLSRTITDPDASPREATAAARAVLEASRVNLQSIETTIRAAEHEELRARIERLERAGGGGILDALKDI